MKTSASLVSRKLSVETKQDEQDTRARIINVATELFARHGFEGASIRAIAKEANVNLAAINYHFASKQNLYHEVLKSGFSQFKSQVSQLAQTNNSSTADFCLAIYDVLLANGPRLLNNFKVLLSESDLPSDLMGQEHPGPPGAEYLLAVLEKECGHVLSLKDGEWAVRIIFTFIVHTALMSCTSFGKQQCGPLFNRNLIASHIERLVKVILSELT